MVDAFSTTGPRAVHSQDGSAFWVAGNGVTAGPGGVNFVSLGSTGAVTNLTGNSNLRYVHIANGQLYGGAQGQLSTVGTGVPTTTGQAITTIGAGVTNGAGFVVLDRNPVVTGVDTIYLARDATAVANTINVAKYTFDGTTWTQATFAVTFTATVNTAFVTAWPEGANVRVVAVQAPANNNRIVTFVDDGSASVAATLVAAAPANERFFGVAPAPTVAP